MEREIAGTPRGFRFVGGSLVATAETVTKCILHLRSGGRARTVSAELSGLGADGAELLVGTLLPVGSTLDVEAAGNRYVATVKSSRPSSNGKWVVALKLASGSWSYEMFRAAAAAGMVIETEAPACLRALGLPSAATAAEVERAYFALARRLHPDRGGTTESFSALHGHYLAALQETGGRR